MRTVPRKRKSKVVRPHAPRKSRRTRRSLLLVFALIFAPPLGLATRSARAACVEIGALPSIAAGNGTTPWTVVTADVDGDGDDDAVAVLYAGDALVWYENDGAAAGWSAHTIASGTVADGAIRLIAADLDGDGDTDVASASFLAGVAWYENVDGAGGSWSRHTVSELYSSLAVAAADLDGDGDLDLVAGGYFSSTVVWYENDGSGGGWAAGTIAATAPLAYAVHAADLDGDGDLDVLDVAAGADQIAWHENLAPGNGSSWAEHVISSAANFAAAVTTADFDADGDLDVAASSVQDATVAWFENDGTPASGVWTPLVVATSGGTISLTAHDLDRDGDPDLVAGGSYFNESDTKSAWYENRGGGWSEHAVVTGGVALSGAAAADLDLDGDFDLLTVDRGANGIAITRNVALHDQPLFAAAATVGGGDAQTSIAAADLDRDGDLDLLASRGEQVIWYDNAAPEGDASSWTQRSISSVAASPFTAVAADLDGDGDTDVVVGDFAAGIAWFENSAGDGSAWTLGTVFSAAAAPSIATADVDQDGDVDVLSAQYASGVVAWHDNSAGDGSTWTVHTIRAGLDAPYSVLAADLDGDGDLDAASTASAPDAILWYENLNGIGTSWTTQTVSTQDGTTVVISADLDGDGDLDLVSSAASPVIWHENTAGDGSAWTDHLIVTGGSAFGGLFAADVDGDGDLDVLAAELFDDNVAWLENDGTPATETWTLHQIAIGLNGSYAVVGADLDGDGDLDAASVAINSQLASFHRNLGTGVFDDGFDSDANKACWSGSTP